MPFQQPNQMKSWNPLSRQFWCGSNFFAENHAEKIAREKRRIAQFCMQRLAEAKMAVATLHPIDDPEEIPHCFKDPISWGLIQVPVLTPDGQIFDRAGLETWLAEHATNPLTNTPLTVNDLKEFPEFHEQLIIFTELQKIVVRLLLQRLHEIKHGIEINGLESEYCYDPASEKLIEEPVVTRSGHVFDRASLEAHLKESQTHPLTGQALTMEDVKPFPAYAKQLDLAKKKAEEVHTVMRRF